MVRASVYHLSYLLLVLQVYFSLQWVVPDGHGYRSLQATEQCSTYRERPRSAYMKEVMERTRSANEAFPPLSQRF